MIIEIYITLWLITLAIIGFAYYLDNVILKVVGVLFIFLQGSQLIWGGIMYSVGQTITTTNSTTMEIVNNYSTFTSTQFGIYLIVIASFWFMLIFVNWVNNRSRGEAQNE